MKTIFSEIPLGWISILISAILAFLIPFGSWLYCRKGKKIDQVLFYSVVAGYFAGAHGGLWLSVLQTLFIFGPTWWFFIKKPFKKKQDII
ncbi:MAG: hypothetical protein WC662_04880 [Candidatus Paceibacterota bacterium]|jgi:hypothetical protein